MKRALITGITGQDASYLSEYLLDLGYEVHGTTRRVSTLEGRFWRLPRLGELRLHYASLESAASLAAVIRQVRPTECYHLAAQSDVKNSFLDEFTTMKVNFEGTHNLLSELYRYAPECRFYFAGTSEMFGGVGQAVQNEETPFNPRSPYAVAKVGGFHLTKHYRESRAMHAVSGILFNHESPRRGEEFVTRKIAKAVAAISQKRQSRLSLGTLAPTRDWGYAPEYVQAMHAMLQTQTPEDFVIATGATHSIEEFARAAFDYVGLDWREFVDYSKDLARPCEVMRLIGDASKAAKVLNWTPKTGFARLVALMVQAELEAL